MIIKRFSENFINANTYVVVPSTPCEFHRGGSEADMPRPLEALVVDPGAGAASWVPGELERLGVSLGAVLLTHGHADHVWDAAAVAGNAPVYISQPDAYRLDDPLSSTALSGYNLGFTRMGATPEWTMPANVQILPRHIYSQAVELVPGLPVRAVATPGHTEGSSVFLVSGAVASATDEQLNSDEERTYMFAGDVIFAGSVGRTDLPGGDKYEMDSSLRFLINVIKPDVFILPGHGAVTTMWEETRTNPFLHAAMS